MDNNNTNRGVTEFARYLPLQLRKLHDIVAKQRNLLVVQLTRKRTIFCVETLHTNMHNCTYFMNLKMLISTH
jgi:hypothetical protein